MTSDIQVKSNGVMELQANGLQITVEKKGLQLTEAQRAEGDWVYECLEIDKKFPNVAKEWVDQCVTWDVFFEQLEVSAQFNRDVVVPFDDISVTLGDTGVMQMRIDEGVPYRVSDRALQQLAGNQYLGCGARVFGLPRSGEEIEGIDLFLRTRMDEVKGVLGSDKNVFLRLRDDGGSRSVRAILSEQYKPVDHRWLMGVIFQNIPSGIISHFDSEKYFSSGGDFLKTNVLIPESLREEKDSGFGGMFSASNSEIGTGRYKTIPSIFRSICRNGCIWGQNEDKKYSVNGVHKGKDTDWGMLAFEFSRTLNLAIPMVSTGIDQYLQLHTLKADSIVPVLFAIGEGITTNKLERKQLWDAFNAEPEAMMENDAYAVVNAVTRYAQELSYDRQEQVEQHAGDLMGLWLGDKAQWDKVVSLGADIDLEKRILEFSTVS